MPNTSHLRTRNEQNYVEREFKDALDCIANSSDPLRAGLVNAVQCLDKRIQADRDLPPELAVRFKKLIAMATEKEKRHENDSVYAATIAKCRTKTRWQFASEIVRLETEFSLAVAAKRTP